MKNKRICRRLKISGVVQGVGFRPFLFVLAKKYQLFGEVSNTSEGVAVIIEGTIGNVESFTSAIQPQAPMLASVTSVVSKEHPVQGYSSFKIVKSVASNSRSTLISPDVTVCRDCLFEMNDPQDRRFGYPFINCTNCGPRYTIIKDIPYDRPKTSMKKFKMCTACQSEYDDPLNRRFHAQPNACPECGPHVFLIDNQSRPNGSPGAEAIDLAAHYLNEGKIVAVKGLGGFHLACDASNQDAVKRLRRQKNRPHKPFALMAASSSVLFEHVRVSESELNLLSSYHRPIVLLKKNSAVVSDSPIADAVAPLNPCLGIMLPYTPLHELLLAKGPDILVMTSGNRSGEPLSIDNEDAVSAFSHIADFFLLHNRDIYFRADDSIARVQQNAPRFIRRSRGYAPLPVYYSKPLPKILACGAGLKNTVCVTRNNYLFLSQHIGDLENLKVYEFYKNSIEHLKKILDIQPELIVHDLHPGYMSTQYAKDQEGIPQIAVQHHHAHAVSCMAENELDEPVIAITLDGTGLGTDGHIWGGEILQCSLDGFERKAHLDYIGMPGGDAAVKEPWRMAASLLFKIFGYDALELDIPYIRQIEKDKLSFVLQMLEKGINTPMTSSCGRVFDAVSALLNIRHIISHESQAAMELEAVADSELLMDAYGFNLEKDPEGDCRKINLEPCIRQIVSDIAGQKETAVISTRFHLTMVAAFAQSTLEISRETGINKIVLSGGVFCNDIIFTRMIRALEDNSLKVYTHTKVPAGDGGISFGQAAAGAAIQMRG